MSENERGMLERVRMALRLSSTDYDEELTDLIAEAEEELKRIGAGEDALASRKAAHYIKTYCRAHFSPDPETAAAYDEALKGIADEIRRSWNADEA